MCARPSSSTQKSIVEKEAENEKHLLEIMSVRPSYKENSASVCTETIEIFRTFLSDTEKSLAKDEV